MPPYPKITIPVTPEGFVYLHVSKMHTSDKKLELREEDKRLLKLLALARRSDLGALTITGKNIAIGEEGWVEVREESTNNALGDIKDKLDAQIKSLPEKRQEMLKGLPGLIENDGRRWRIGWEPEMIYLAPEAFEGSLEMTRSRGRLTIEMRTIKEGEWLQFTPKPFSTGLSIPEQQSLALLSIPVSDMKFDFITKNLKDFRRQLSWVGKKGKKRDIEKLCETFTCDKQKEEMKALFFDTVRDKLKDFPFSAVKEYIDNDDFFNSLWGSYFTLIEEFKAWALGKVDTAAQILWEQRGVEIEDLEGRIATYGMRKIDTWTARCRDQLEHIALSKNVIDGAQNQGYLENYLNMPIRKYLRQHGLLEFYADSQQDGHVELHYTIDFKLGSGEVKTFV